MKKIYLLGVLCVPWLLATAVTQPPSSGPDQPLLKTAHAPPQVLSIFQRSCQNCHSSSTEWPLYSRMFPVSLLITRDVHDARSQLDLTGWQYYDDYYRGRMLAQIGAVTRNRIMPPARYLLVHPESRLTAGDIEILYRWTRSERNRLAHASQTSTHGLAEAREYRCVSTSP